MELKMAKHALSRVLPELERISTQDEFEHNSNGDELFESRLMLEIAYKIKDVVHLVNYMNKPIISEGYLQVRDDGRYEITGTNYYFASGSLIEVWDEEYQEYFKTRIEYKNGDYFAVGCNDSLEGLKVRCR